MRIEFNGSTQDIVGEMMGFLALFTAEQRSIEQLAEVAPAVAADQPKPRGRPKKTIAEMQAAEKPAGNGPDSSTPSADDATQALRRYSEKHGMEAAKKLINSLGAVKMSLLPPEKYAELIAQCPPPSVGDEDPLS